MKQHVTTARVGFVASGDPARPEVERFIHATYARIYGADINHFMPELFSLRATDGALLAAMGLRPAGDLPLFLEHYLDAPVDRVLTGHLGEAVARGRLVELGNLASGHAGGARLMIIALTAILAGAGYEWVAFTAVPAVYNAFRRLGLELLPLAEADGRRLGPDLARWGSYYHHRPLVVAGNVRQGYAALDAMIQAEQALAMVSPLWQQAHAAGAAHPAAGL